MKEYGTIGLKGNMLKIPVFCMTALLFNNVAGFSQVKGGTEDGNNSDVWTLQADSYSGKMELKKSEAKKLLKAYIAFREEVKAGNPEDAANFDQKLGGILSDDQRAQALMVLGSLNSRWDSYLKILLGYSLSEDKMKSASVIVCNYMVQYLEARAEAEKSNSRFSSLIARALKEELDSGLSAILTDDQKTDWDIQTARKQRNS